MSAALPEVLLVEDNEDDAFFFRRAFGAIGMQFEILHLENGEDAIAFLDEHLQELKNENEAPPLLVVLDLKMPKANGFSVLEWIQDQGKLNLMVVILTASNQQHDIERADAFHVAAYLVKPSSMEDTKQVARCICHLWMNHFTPEKHRALFNSVE